MPTRTHHLHAASVVLALLAGCAGIGAATDDGAGSGAPAAEPAHGYVAGAEEVPEAQVTLAVASRGDRSLVLLDLATERTETTPLAIPAETIAEDGRYVYVGDDRGRVEIVDTGVWTVDHGDHVHHYRAAVRSIGSADIGGSVTSVFASETQAMIGSTDGSVTVVDRRALADGEIVVLDELDVGTSAPFAVPHDGELVLPSTAVTAGCTNPLGAAALRAGVAIGCDEGILLVKTGRTALLPYDRSAPRLTGFEHRPRSNEAAGPAGDAGAWSVDALDEALSFVPSSTPIVAVASPADDEHLVTIDVHGTMRLSRLGDGTPAAEADVLDSDAIGPIRIDVSRTYAFDVDGRRVIEIDHRDSLRVARSIDLPIRPELVVEVGR